MNKRDPKTRERVGDQGAGWLKRHMSTCPQSWHDHWREYGVLIVGIGLVAVATGLIILATIFYSAQQDTNNQSRISCERTQKFAPVQIDFFEKAGVYTPELAKLARDTIPKQCN